MKQVCEISGELFEISDSDLKFYSEIGSKSPKKCPWERNRLRMSFRNFMSLYWRNCDASGERILSMYPENSNYKVYSPEYWWSSNWEARDYARQYDPKQKFCEQFGELLKQVPKLSTVQLNSENCLYTNFTFFSNNCYLIYGCVKSSDCNYGHIVWESSNCLDCLYSFQSQWCAYCVDIAGCYEVFYSIEAINCRNSYFLYDCRNCQDCYACYNLRNKQYCIMNKQYSKEEYKEKLKLIFPISIKQVDKFKTWLNNAIQEIAIKPDCFNSQSEDITGNHLYNCKNLNSCFDTKKSENSAYIYTGLGVINSYDLSFTGARAEFCLDSLTLTNCERVRHSHYCIDSYELAYCDFCINSKDLFGCAGLKNAQYCILNQQYSKTEYFKLREQIVNNMKREGEYGEFFPATLSAFAYNESVANDYAPLDKNAALNLGYTWKDEEPEIIKSDSSSLVCRKSGKLFKITKQEHEFLSRFCLPLPETCFKERHLERMSLRGKRDLNSIACHQCKVPLRSSNLERVLCERCYLSNIGQ